MSDFPHASAAGHAPLHGQVHGGPQHPYHLVNPSPWPLIASLGAFVMAVGAVHWWHGGTWAILVVGLATVVVVAAMWWRDVVHEASINHTPVVRHGLRVGMGLFIASEVMFFAAFFWAFFHSSMGFSPPVTQWPPAGIEPLETWDLPFLNTLILVSSGLTLNWAHHALQHDNRRDLIRGLLVTVILGFLFLSLQAYEYGHAAFGFKDGIFPSVFYMATGFHGFHVFVGACFLTVNLLRAVKGGFRADQHVGFEAAAWYWHFVDVVWIFLFVWVYWWGNS